MGILVVLGIVQGLCEFLPISSSGHLVLLSRWFGVENSLFVSIILHIATLLSIFVVLRKEVFSLIRHPFSKDSLQLSISTIITCVVAIILMPFISTSFEGEFLPWAFLITSALLFIVEKLSKTTNHKNKELSFKQAVIIGLAQGLAIFPGISRSGATISAGALSGADREKSAKFSFLVSIPIIIASLIMEIIKIVILAETISVNPWGLILSFLIWISEILRVYFVFLAFGADVNLIIIGEVFIVACLVGMIPLLPGGLGAVDGLMILLYSAAGVPASVSAAATVIERLISFWMATMLGMAVLPYFGSSVLNKISFTDSPEEIEEVKEIESNN